MADQQLLPADNSGSNWLDNVLKLTSGAVDSYAKLNQTKVEALEKKASVQSNVLPASQGGGIDTKTILIVGGIVAAVVAIPLVIRAMR